MAATDVVSSLQREVQLVKEGLKGVDEDIKKLTGRDPSETRGPFGNRRVQLKRNFGERSGGPAQKRFVTRSAYSRLGPPPDNREQRFRQLESDGEEDDDDDDDDHKPTLQSSVVAPPAPSRLKQETILNADKKTQTRNKRMFGVLLGTLQKFRETSNKEAIREKRRQEIEQKLEAAAVKEKEEASRQRKELFFARKEKQKKLEDLERKIEAAEELDEWEAHDQKLTKFIRSQTKPHIFYLPAKHTDHTLDLLEKTAKHLKDEMKKRRDDLQDVLHDAEADEVAVDTKKNSKRRRTPEEDQDTVRKQDSGDNGEGEDERNGGIKEDKVEMDTKEKECEVKAGEEKEDGEENEKERNEENEEVDKNERKRTSGESELKEEGNVRVKEESKQEDDQGLEVVLKTEEKDAVDTVEEKEKEGEPMQVDLEPNVAE